MKRILTSLRTNLPRLGIYEIEFGDNFAANFEAGKTIARSFLCSPFANFKFLCTLSGDVLLALWCLRAGLISHAIIQRRLCRPNSRTKRSNRSTRRQRCVLAQSRWSLQPIPPPAKAVHNVLLTAFQPPLWRDKCARTLTRAQSDPPTHHPRAPFHVTPRIT